MKIVEANVHVITADGALRRALVSRLQNAPDLPVTVLSERPDNGHYAPGEILLIPVTELPIPRCEELARQGLRLIVLAPMPRESDAAHYRDAGAVAYIPMSVDLSLLFNALKDVVGSEQSSAVSGQT